MPKKEKGSENDNDINKKDKGVFDFTKESSREKSKPIPVKKVRTGGEKRSIRELGIERIHKKPGQAKRHEWQMERTKETKFASSIGLWVFGAVVIVFLFFLISGLFAGASISVTPMQESINVDTEITLSPSSEEGSAITYELMTITGQVESTVPAEGQEFEEAKASGQITVFNEFTDEPTRLVANTRFEAPNGNIYRAEEAFTVPGRNGDTPGSIDITVVADEAGNDFNIGIVDFTVPGFEGEPEFDSYYAKSVTEMTGGFEGTRNTVSESTRAEVEDELESKLRDNLIAKVNADIPKGFIALPGTETLNFSLENTGGTGENVDFVGKGSMSIALANESSLARNLLDASSSTRASEDSVLSLTNADSLKVTLLEKDEEEADEETIDISVLGSALVVWNVNLEELEAELLGKKKSAIDTILRDFEEVRSAEVKLRPFWKRTIPTKTNKVDISIANIE